MGVARDDKETCIYAYAPSCPLSSLTYPSPCAFFMAGKRLFGLLSAGATLGQLAGSLVALLITKLAPSAAGECPVLVTARPANLSAVC